MFMVYSITGAALNVNDNRNGFRISNLTIKQRITTTKNVLKYYNVEMSPMGFKIKLNPKIIRQGKIFTIWEKWKSISMDYTWTKLN